MGANVNVWPRCGCSERCTKPSCARAGGAAVNRLPRAQVLEAVGISNVGRKNSPERMSAFLDRIMLFPGVVNACLFCGFTYSTLTYWLKKSATGRPGDGFDLEYGEETKRFHEHFIDCRDAAVQIVEDAYVERAMHGYYETLHHQGRVAYQFDQQLLDLGMTGPDAYLKDERGKPIPERIQHQDPEVMLAVLKAWRRDKYGAHDTLDITHKGGVMVVTAPARTSAELETRAVQMAREPIDVEFTDVDPNVVPVEVK